MADFVPAARYAGASAADIAARCGVSRVVLYDELSSTLDAAHLLARDGAPEGTLVLAERQTAGRGRNGRAWSSEPLAGIWLTLIGAQADDAAMEVLSLRVGLAAARVLDAFATACVRMKWPNDLMVDGGKLGGILIERRWHGARVDWVAIGIGINCRVPRGVPNGRALREGVSRVEVLSSLVPAVREAAQARGGLTELELDDFARRDWARGRRCRAPIAGVVHGIDASGALLVYTGAGDVAARSGSLILEEES